MTATRRLAAILATDVAGYSRLIGADEEGTLERLKAIRRAVVDPKIAEHHGRIVKTTGDGFLVEFASVIDALRFADQFQSHMAERNATLSTETRIDFRVGINMGDVVAEDGDLFGDGVNVAARLEALADPGGICVSARVQEDAAGRLDLTFDDLGEQQLKNIARPVRVFRIRLGDSEPAPIDAIAATHLWADRFDGSLEDVFELQDRIAVNVAGVIEPALQAAEMRRSAARPTIDLTAYDLYLRALAVFFPITKERISAALKLLEQAVAIDRHYGPALSWAAVCHMRLAGEGWAEDPEKSRRMAVDLAREAIQVAESDPGILTNSAFVLACFGEDIGAMIALIDRALTLNPSFARGWFLSSLLRIWADEPDAAIEHAETSLRLSPRERMGTPLLALGTAYLVKHQFEQAASKLLLSIQDDPGSPPAYRALAACFAHMGRLDEARTIVARLRAITPQVVPTNLPSRNPEHRELLLSGLRMAMGEAT